MQLGDCDVQWVADDSQESTALRKFVIANESQLPAVISS